MNALDQEPHAKCTVEVFTVFSIAVKTVSLSYASIDEKNEQITRLQNEASLIHMCKHPNIINLFSTDLEHDEFRFYFELYPMTLREHIDQGDFPTDIIIISLYLQAILNGLIEIHDQNIIHRDIKSSNIFINPITKRPSKPLKMSSSPCPKRKFN